MAPFIFGGECFLPCKPVSTKVGDVVSDVEACSVANTGLNSEVVSVVDFLCDVATSGDPWVQLNASVLNVVETRRSGPILLVVKCDRWPHDPVVLLGLECDSLAAASLAMSVSFIMVGSITFGF